MVNERVTLNVIKKNDVHFYMECGPVIMNYVLADPIQSSFFSKCNQVCHSSERAEKVFPKRWKIDTFIFGTNTNKTDLISPNNL